MMSSPHATPVSEQTFPAQALPQIHVPAWAWLVVLAAVATIYFVTLENGALLGSAANTLHEFMHDGRHVVGVPCH